MTDTPPPAAAELVRAWRDAGPRRWFKPDPAFDAALRARFGALHRAAAEGRPPAWANTPGGALALVLLLDQVPRNIHRGSPLAYATDTLALRAARGAIERGWEGAVDLDLRPFLHMPFEHAEDLAAQDEGVRLRERLAADGGDPDGSWLRWARHHRDIVTRFGRFPHRNAVLGRESTPDERAFLDTGGFSG